jgi:hypothetical protein
MMTLRKCEETCKNLRWTFPDKDIAIVFDAGVPRVEVQG